MNFLLSGYLRNLNISGGGHIRVGTGNSFAHFWSVTSWLVSNSRLVATLVDVDTLVVTEVFTTTPLESHAESPFGGVTRLSETCNVSVWIGFFSLGSVAGHLVL